MWSAVLAPGLPHSAQMVALPSLRMVRLLALYWGSLYGDVMSGMLLAPLLRCSCFHVCAGLGCLCPPHFTAVRCWLPDCLGWNTNRLLCR